MRGFPRLRMPLARRGLSSMIVIGFTVVIFIVFARLIYMLKEGAFMASHFHRRGILANVADGGAAVGLNVLDRLFGDPASEPFKALTEEGNYKERVFEIYPKGPFPLKCLSELESKYPGCSLEVKARVFYLQPFGEVFEPGIMKQIQKEKIGVLEVSSAASFAAPKYKQVVRERRWIKITSQALPVLSRFNLFLQEANKTGAPTQWNFAEKSPKYSKEWNRIVVSEAGTADGEPLVLGSGKVDPRGWVFLGGGEKPQQAILLGLAGGNTKLGEGHHFFPDIFQNDAQRVHFFNAKTWPDLVKTQILPKLTWHTQRNTPEDVGISSEKEHPILTSDPNDPTKQIPIKDMTDGLFNSGMCKEIADIPEMKELVDHIGKYSNQKEGTAPQSSVLHLIGEPTASVPGVDNSSYPPGPSGIIMGNVFRSYSQIGVFQFYKIKYDASGNITGNRWDITGFWPFGMQGTFFDAVRAGEQAEKANPTSYDQSGYVQHPIYEAFKMEFQQPYTDWNKMPSSGGSVLQGFQADVAMIHYLNNMSMMLVEPYATSSQFYSKLRDAKMAPPALDADWGKDDECQYGSVLPAKDKSQGLMKREERDFTKSLNGFFLPEKYFTMRETVRYKGENAVKDFDALFKEHIRGGTLEFGKFIVIENKDPITLPDIDKVEKGGVIVATGDISVGKIGDTSLSVSDPDKLCSRLMAIVSLGGKVTLRGGPVNAQIVALGSPEDPSKKRDGKDGRLPVPMPFSGPITGKVEFLAKAEITGALACREIDPDALARKGGTLVYNPVLSPDHDKGYLENNHAFCINLMPKIEEWEVKAE